VKSPSESRVRDRYSTILFWTAACLLLFWGLGERSLWGPEGRWGEITREMFLTGDFFHPAINGNPYFDKPLLTYWLIALVSMVTGRLNEWTVRIPSAAAALLGLWATVDVGRRLWSGKVGRTAGWMLLTTYGILYWGRPGTADMENLAAIALAVAWYWARREKLNLVTYLVFYLICFLGAQTKGLTAVVVPILIVLPDMLRDRRWRALFTLSHVAALVLVVAFYLAPFIYAETTRAGYQESGLALVFRENIQRYFEPFDHAAPFYIYFYYLPGFFLPWAPLLLIALAGSFLSIKRMNPRTRWLAEALILVFCFFLFSGSRRSYYILPMLPLCALLTAVFFEAHGTGPWKRLGVGLQGGLLILLASLEILSPAIWTFVKTRTDFVPPDGLRLLTLGIGLLALVPWVLRRAAPNLLATLTGTDNKLAPLIVTGAILMGGLFGWQQQSLEIYRTESPFVRELKTRVAGPPAKEIAFYQIVSPKVLFVLDYPRPVRILPDPDAVLRYFNTATEPRILVSRNELVEKWLSVLPEAWRNRPPTWSDKILPWEQRGSGKWSGKLSAWEFQGEAE